MFNRWFLRSAREPILDAPRSLLARGVQGTLAAKQAEEIIEVLCSRIGAFQVLKRKQTKRGEFRLENCRKYDLGGGYRLITIQNGDLLFLTYAGNHDECHLWLEKHKDVSLNTSSLISSSQILQVSFSQPQAVDTSQLSDSSQEPDPLEEDLFSRIDEKTLRSVFSGICQSK